MDDRRYDKVFYGAGSVPAPFASTGSGNSNGSISINGSLYPDWFSNTKESKMATMTDYSDKSLGEALDEFLQARDKVNRIKELRRLFANSLRVDANQQDAKTNLVVEEVNEVAPIKPDYEPVWPIPSDSDDEE